MRSCLAVTLALSAVVIAVAVLHAQPAPAAGAGDSTVSPDEPVIRLTPGIARGMARTLVHEELIRRYEIDAAHEDEITELLARRFMEAAHEIDTPETQAVLHRVGGNFFRMVVESHRKHQRIASSELGEPIARDLLPLMPNARELVRKVGQDIRPMLPMKQQLRLAADLMAVNTAMDGFEATMQRWSKGEINPDDDPFHPDDDLVQLGPDGVSQQVTQARERSAHEDRLPRLTNVWEEYVKQAVQLYGFDESQKATAESVVRETIAKATAVLNDSEFRTQDDENRFWLRFSRSLGPENRGDQPLMYLLLRQASLLQGPLNQMTDELKERVDRIARQDQQRAAGELMQAKLAELGYEPPEQTDPPPP